MVAPQLSHSIASTLTPLPSCCGFSSEPPTLAATGAVDEDLHRRALVNADADLPT